MGRIQKTGIPSIKEIPALDKRIIFYTKAQRK